MVCVIVIAGRMGGYEHFCGMVFGLWGWRMIKFRDLEKADTPSDRLCARILCSLGIKQGINNEIAT